MLGAVAAMASPATGGPVLAAAVRSDQWRRRRGRNALAAVMGGRARRATACAFGEAIGGKGGQAQLDAASASAIEGDIMRGAGGASTSLGSDVAKLEKDFMATLREHYGSARLVSLDLSESGRGPAGGPARGGTVVHDPQVCGFHNTYGCSLLTRYSLGDEIARGAFGTVRAATDKVSGEEVAVKTIRKNKLNQDSYVAESIKAEIDILGTVQGCAGVVELYDVQEDARDLHVVTELLRGGTLWDAMEDGRMEGNEDAVKPVVRQILAMLRDIHARGVVHRDVKPRNFMLDREDLGAARVVGLDFGSASLIPEQGLMTAAVGTPTYMAPEVADQQKRGYTELCDLWSVGVIVYQALTGGRVPFQQVWDRVGNTDAAVSGLVSVQSILDTLAAIDDMLNALDCDTVGLLFPPGTVPAADSFSPELRDFLTRLLSPETKRMSAAQALEHPWLAAH